MNKRIIGLTREMLFNGVFNHLPDEELNALHKLLLTIDENQDTSLYAIMCYWYKGAFDDNGMSLRFLHSCNENLLRTGHSTLEVYI